MEGSSVTSLQGGEVRCRDVADVEHVARLVAVAVDRHRPALDHPAREDRDDPTLFGEEVLTRAVHVGVAKHRVVQMKGSFEGPEVLLERELARPVWRQRADRVVLAGGDDVGLTVKRSACGAEDHLPDRVVDARPQHVQAADDVDLCVVAGISD